MSSLVTLVCPDCRLKLARNGARYHCTQCTRTFTDNGGILSFLTPEERYNESPYETDQVAAWTSSARIRERIRASSLLTLLNRVRIQCSLSGRRDRIFLSELKRSRTARPLILDIGCGGGRHYFCDHGLVIGIDPVIDLLFMACQIYDEVYQCSGFNLPFADDTFDYVFSSDVIGHITAPDKDRLFGEIHRVLKPGGRTVHCSEALASNPWWKFALQHPDLYQKYFVDKPGHIGLEPPQTLRERFLKHGFKEVRFRKLSSIIQEPGVLAALFDNEFKEKCKVMAFLVAVDRLLAKQFAVKELINFILEPIAQLDDWITPLDYASGVLTVHEK